MQRVGPQLVADLLSDFHPEALSPQGFFALQSAWLADDNSHFIYTFGPTGVQLVLERVTDPSATDRPGRRWARTRCFNVLVQRAEGAAQLTAVESALVRQAIESIRRREPEAVTWVPSPTLFLVPGTIGDPYDLTVRALDILSNLPVLLVEAAKRDALSMLFEIHGLTLEGKRIVELNEAFEVPPTAESLLEEIVEADQDAGLFGVDEGVPGFCDPGKTLVAAASRFGDRLRIRTVGGPSAIAMALMRVPFPMDRFLFVGATRRDPVEEAREALARGDETALVFLHTEKWPDLARRMIAACVPLGAEVLLACNLTCEDEWFAHIRPGDPPDQLPQLNEETRLMIIVRPPAPPHLG
jgi:16S rRNA C1402 (ribose-2'-O) methylase RsmI